MKKLSLMILLFSLSLSFVACTNNETIVENETIINEGTNNEQTNKGDEESTTMNNKTKLQIDYEKAINAMKELTKDQLKLPEELSAYQLMCGKDYVEYNNKNVVEIIVMKDLGERMETMNIYYFDVKNSKFYLYDAVTDTVSSLRPER